MVAHEKKTVGGGLAELRRVLARAGHRDPLWFTVRKSKKAPRAVKKALDEGANLLLVWGGDGMVQHCIDALGDARAAMAIVPAGTANLLASHLGIPRDIPAAVDIALHGARRKLDVGTVNGERFAVMAGTGLDAEMIRRVDGAQKKKLGRLAYARAGAAAVRGRRFRARVNVDGADWFEGPASAVLIGNIGTVSGGVTVFPAASPRDGLLEVGVATARSVWQWVRLFSRVASGHVDRSPFVELTRGKEIVVELGRKRPYELDGGVRPATKHLKLRIERAALTLCVPRKRRSAGV